MALEILRASRTTKACVVGSVTALLDRLLHHAHVLKCGLRSYRTERLSLQPATDEG